jgi:hypothetical protein
MDLQVGSPLTSLYITVGDPLFSRERVGIPLTGLYITVGDPLLSRERVKPVNGIPTLSLDNNGSPTVIYKPVNGIPTLSLYITVGDPLLSRERELESH